MRRGLRRFWWSALDSLKAFIEDSSPEPRYRNGFNRTPRAGGGAAVHQGGAMRLHVFPPSPRAIKVLALRNHLDIPCDVRVMNYFRQEQRQPEFAELNPNRRMPVLEDDGFVLWESNAILFYLAAKKPEAALWPADARAQADTLRWMSWEGAHLVPALSKIIDERKKLIGLASGQPDDQRIAEGLREFYELATLLDAHLLHRTWLVGDKLTIADFSVACWLSVSKRGGFEVDDYPSLTRWYGAIDALPAWQGALAASRQPLT
jgi:glutathione S-transferase